MSPKTRSRKTRATSTTAATLHPVPDRNTPPVARTNAEHKLWKALRANPNNTTADLAHAAKIGQSTAGKILAALQKEGSVTRTPGIGTGGRRTADRWAIADTEPTTDTPVNGPGDNVSTTNDADSTDSAQRDTTTPDDVGAARDDAEPAPVTSTDSTTTSAPEPEPLDAEPTKPAAKDSAADGTTSHGAVGKPARLAPGALRGMVEDYLRDHPGDEFGPTAIAHALGGRSSGAVNNALEKLVTNGTAIRAKESPKRFTLAPTAE